MLCWGRGESGQLGHGKFTHSAVSITVKIPGDKSVQTVACGSHFTMALTEEGGLFTWGCNENGQLGQGDRMKKCVPTPVGGMLAKRHVHMMACGYDHALALTTAREVFTWGRNSHGQLGHGVGQPDSLFPMELRVMSGLDIKVMAAGDSHSCVLTSLGDIYTWGRGDFGQLGHGDGLLKDVPTLIQVMRPDSEAHSGGYVISMYGHANANWRPR